MRTIRLNDGTEFEGNVGYDSGVIWCYVNGKNITELFPFFSDPAKTQRIEYLYGEMQDVYEGFTVLGAIMQAEDQTQIMLRKEA